MSVDIVLIALLMFVVAALYSSVGHAGATGYLAVMALFAFAPNAMKPTALVLNLFVASIATVKFYRVGAFSWRVFLPFAVASVPFAYIGGTISLATNVYKPVVATALLFAAIRFFVQSKTVVDDEVKPMPVWIAIICGAILGFLSGLTGIGGGVFLSPLLLTFKWTNTRTTAGISAAFIFVNSMAGIFGQAKNFGVFGWETVLFIAAVVIGGFLGAEMGSRRLANARIRFLLGVVLLIASARMFFD